MRIGESIREQQANLWLKDTLCAPHSIDIHGRGIKERIFRKQQEEVMVEIGIYHLTIKSQILFTKSSFWAPVLVTSTASGPTYLYPLCLLYSNCKMRLQFLKGPGSYLFLSLACLSPPHPLRSNWNTTSVKFPKLFLSPREFLSLMVPLNFTQNYLISHTMSWYFCCNVFSLSSLRKSWE